ncbi:hypothetical protein V8E36_007611 [Tilletia maclaganii]
MPHASIIVPSVIGVAAAAAAFEVTVFKPWRERNAPQGLHVLLGEELQKFGRTAGRTAEEFGRQAGQSANEFGGRVRDEVRKVGDDLQHAAGELREGFLDLTQPGRHGRPDENSGSVRLEDHEEDYSRYRGHGEDDERHGLMRNDTWASSHTSAIDRPMYAPPETDYDPDDEQTLASLQRRRRATSARDDSDNITLRDSGAPPPLPPKHSNNHILDEVEDEGTAAFRAHRSLLGQTGSGAATGAGATTIFDLEDFDAARDAFGFEDVQSPHHTLGSPSIAASDAGADDFFSHMEDEDAKHLDASTLSIANNATPAEANPAATSQPMTKAPSAGSASGEARSVRSDDWQEAALSSSDSAAQAPSESDGEIISISAAASEAGDSVVRAPSNFGSEGWIDLDTSSPDSLSPPTSPSSRQRQLQL